MWNYGDALTPGHDVMPTARHGPHTSTFVFDPTRNGSSALVTVPRAFALHGGPNPSGKPLRVARSDTCLQKMAPRDAGSGAQFVR
jgi:hypothetical protein